MLETLSEFSKLEREFRSDRADNFFQKFEDRIKSCKATYKYYHWINDWLQFIPENQWVFFSERISQTVNIRDLKQLRYWEKFHDVLFEAFGFRLLIDNLKCKNPKYIHSKLSAPDFEASSNGKTVLLEVKKINESQQSIEMWHGDRDEEDVRPKFSKLRKKLKAAYNEAIAQLDSFTQDTQTEKHVFLIIEPDVFLGTLPLDTKNRIISIVSEIESEPYILDWYLIDRE